MSGVVEPFLHGFLTDFVKLAEAYGHVGYSC